MGPGVCHPPGERPTISLPASTIVNRASIITTTTSRRRQRIVISLRLSHLRLHTYTQTDRQTPIAKRYRKRDLSRDSNVFRSDDSLSLSLRVIREVPASLKTGNILFTLIRSFIFVRSSVTSANQSYTFVQNAIAHNLHTARLTLHRLSLSLILT